MWFESLADRGDVYENPWMERFPEIATFYLVNCSFRSRCGIA